MMIAVQFSRNADAISASARALAARICDLVARELGQLLPGLPDEITLYCSLGENVIPQIGYGAAALDKRTVGFVIEPAPSDRINKILDVHLRHALYHECHHLVRGWVKHGGRPPKHFIDGVVCEGLASAFERDAAGYPTPWCEYPDNASAWVDELLALSAGADYGHWMFHHPDGRQWIGYKAGVYIADRATERSGLDAAQLVSVAAEHIIELAEMRYPSKCGTAAHNARLG